MTSDRQTPEQVLQNILQNVQVGGNLTTGDISQILNLFISINPPESFKPTGIPQNIPSSGTIKFVGRSEELEGLHQMLQQNNQVAIAAIAGMGGVGKTELATQYALLHLLLLTYPGAICWLRAREEDIGFQVVQFAQTELGLKPPEDLDLPKQVRWCWRRWREGNALVVLDDVNDYLKVEPYLPPQPSQFKVLITTRLQLDLPQSLTLDVLGEVAALDLLQQWVEAETINQHLIDAKELCQRLGYLPLALNLVGRYIKKRKISLPEMLRRLDEKGLRHQSLDVDKNDRTWTFNIKRGVAAAVELSWEELSENAKQLGCLLSLFALAPIPWSLVESVATEQDPEDLEDVRVELENLHLLQGEETYQLHQLIREFFQEKLAYLAQANGLKRTLASVMVAMAKQIPYPPTYGVIESLTPKVPHLAEVATTLTEFLDKEDLAQLFTRLGEFYEGQGIYSKAKYWYEQCLSVTQHCLGDNHPAVAMSLNNLGLLYKFQGCYGEAERLYVQALELRRHLEEDNHSDIEESLYNLGILYLEQGRYTEAEPLLMQALEVRKDLLGDDHPHVAYGLNALALLYKAQGRYSEAEPLYIQALELRKPLLGDDHPLIATSLGNLGLLYSAQGRYSEAEPLYIQALDIRKRLLGDEHPDVAISLDNLANSYHEQGCYSEAETLSRQALELRRRLLGDEHPDVTYSLNNLAELYREQEQYTDAEQLHVRALEIRRRLLGDEHPLVASSMHNLAQVYREQDRYAEAEPLYLRALEIRRYLLGNEHPDVAQNLNNLALLYQSQCQYSEAQLLYLKALVICEQRLGTAHPWTVNVRENFVACFKQAIAQGWADLEALPDKPTIQAILAEVQASLEQSE